MSASEKLFRPAEISEKRQQKQQASRVIGLPCSFMVLVWRSGTLYDQSLRFDLVSSKSPVKKQEKGQSRMLWPGEKKLSGFTSRCGDE